MINVRTTLILAAATLFSATTFGEDATPSTKITLTPEEMTYSVRPGAPPGVTTATLIGDPSKSGIYVFRNRFPPGSKLAPHSHSDAWRIMTVLEGTLYFAYGDVFDEKNLKRLGPGSIIVEPKDTPHYLITKSEGVLLQIVAEGPFTTTYVEKR